MAAIKYEIFPKERTRDINRAVLEATAIRMAPSAKTALEKAQRLGIIRDSGQVRPKLSFYFTDDGKSINSLKFMVAREQYLSPNIRIAVEAGSRKYMMKDKAVIEPGVAVHMVFQGKNQSLIVDYKMFYEPNGEEKTLVFGGSVFDAARRPVDSFYYRWDAWKGGKPNVNIVKLGAAMARGQMAGEVRNKGFERFMSYWHVLGL